jgi:hypothetical protein
MVLVLHVIRSHWSFIYSFIFTIGRRIIEGIDETARNALACCPTRKPLCGANRKTGTIFIGFSHLYYTPLSAK